MTFFSYLCGMNKYVEYIEELLYLYDCVIVPGFGGFIGLHESATINEKQGVILPPRKKVIFNHHLKQNDGLLIEWIARKESIPYEKAERRVALFREEVRVRLNQRQRVEFGHIGSFTTDRRLNLVFTPSGHNFLADTHCMGTLPLPQAHASGASINSGNGNLLTRLFKYGISAAVITGIVIISQQDIFHSEGHSAVITGIQPTLPQRPATNEQPATVVSPASDFVDFDPLSTEP